MPNSALQATAKTGPRLSAQVVSQLQARAMASILIAAPQVEEVEPLLHGFLRRGFPSQDIQLGAMKCWSITSLDMLVMVGGNGKAQFAVQTQYGIHRCPNAELLFCVGAAAASPIFSRSVISSWELPRSSTTTRNASFPHQLRVTNPTRESYKSSNVLWMPDIFPFGCALAASLAAMKTLWTHCGPRRSERQRKPYA